MSYAQYIVVDRKLNMSRGKLMAQASHASIAFLTNQLKVGDITDDVDENGNPIYHIETMIDKDVYDNWLNGIFTKIVLAVDGKEEFYDVVKKAEENGLVEGKDFFVIRDSCLTELIPENEDGTCATCIGFLPTEKDKLKPVVGNLPLFR